MAFSDNSFNKNRGLDPGAMRVLDSRKKSKDNRTGDLKRKQVERELAALRARLAVIDRELQRLAVSERRFHGDEARAHQEFEKESHDFEEITKELGTHSEKAKELQRLLGTKKSMVSRFTSSNNFGREAAEKEAQMLRNELRRVDQEIDQLSSKKRRIASEIMQVQNKIKQAGDIEHKMSSQSDKIQTEIDGLLQELHSEETTTSRMKIKFNSEQRSVLEKKRQLEEVEKRMQGVATGHPVLESEKAKLEKQIQDLERKLQE